MPLALLGPITPIIVKVVGKPTPEVSVADIILESLGLTGLLLIGSAIFGALLGGLFILYRIRQRNRTAQPEEEAIQLKLSSVTADRSTPSIRA